MNTINHRKSESGQAIVLLVFGMIVLMGMAGLAIDGGNLYAQKRRGQAAVDNAALAYALALNQGSGSGVGQGNATTVLSSNGYIDGQNSVTITMINPVPGYTNPNSYVEVILTQTVPTAFIHLVYGGPAVYSARATAHGQSSSAPMAGFAIVGMGNCLSIDVNLQVTGGGNSGGINVYDGEIFVNSPEDPSNHCAIDPPSSTNNTGITVEGGFDIFSVGSYDYAGEPYMYPVPIQTGYNGGVPITDPLASVSDPTCTENGSVNTAPNPDEYSPGNFGGAGQPSMGWGHYNPGIYCITGGINPNGDGTITGDGVLFYLKTGGITMSGNQGMSITAPTTSNCLGAYGQTSASCTYVGMTIFAARGNTSTIDVRGNGGSAVTGTIYALDGTIQASGGGSNGSNPACPDLPDNEETCIIGQIIAAKIVGNGNGSLLVDYEDPVIFNLPPSINLTR